MDARRGLGNPQSQMTGVLRMLSLLHECWNLNCGPHDCTERSLNHEGTSPDLEKYIFWCQIYYFVSRPHFYQIRVLIIQSQILNNFESTRTTSTWIYTRWQPLVVRATHHTLVPVVTLHISSLFLGLPISILSCTNTIWRISEPASRRSCKSSIFFFLHELKKCSP